MDKAHIKQEIQTQVWIFLFTAKHKKDSAEVGADKQ